MARLAVLLIFLAAFGSVVLSTYRFRLEPTWRMDPLPFAFFLALAFLAGRASGRIGARGSTKRG